MYDDYDGGDRKSPKHRKPHVQTEEEYFNQTREKKYDTLYHQCDKRLELYVLNQTQFIQGRVYHQQKGQGCSKYGFIKISLYYLYHNVYFRPHFAKRIPKSNLLMVVIDAMHESCMETLTTKPQPIEYEIKSPCHKLKMNDLPRRRLDECFTEHPDEEANHYCGSSQNIDFNIFLIILCITVLLLKIC